MFTGLLLKFTGFFQYNVSFDLEIDSFRVNNLLLYRVSGILGPTKRFDSMTMLLPLKLPELQDLQRLIRRIHSQSKHDAPMTSLQIL